MRVIGAIVLVACLGGAAGCGTVPDSPARGTASVEASGPRATSGATGPTYSSKGADILFAQMTLLHHQQTVALAELLTTKSGMRAEVREIAQRL